REHQLGEGPLLKRVSPHQHMELAHDLVLESKCELAVDLVADCRKPHLRQTVGVGLGESLIAELGERVTAHELEGAGTQRTRRFELSQPEVAPALSPCVLESIEIELGSSHPQQVSGS